MNIKENIEPLDELSKSTLGSYIKKAGEDKSVAAMKIQDARQTRDMAFKDTNTNNISNKVKNDYRDAVSKESGEKEQESMKKYYKRSKGISHAVDRLVKENVQQMLSAIANKDTETAANIFNSTLAQKVSDRLESFKVSVADSYFNGFKEGAADMVEEEVEPLDEAYNEKTPLPKLEKLYHSYKKKEAKSKTGSGAYGNLGAADSIYDHIVKHHGQEAADKIDRDTSKYFKG